MITTISNSDISNEKIRKIELLEKQLLQLSWGAEYFSNLVFINVLNDLTWSHELEIISDWRISIIRCNQLQLYIEYDTFRYWKVKSFQTSYNYISVVDVINFLNLLLEKND